MQRVSCLWINGKLPWKKYILIMLISVAIPEPSTLALLGMGLVIPFTSFAGRADLVCFNTKPLDDESSGFFVCKFALVSNKNEPLNQQLLCSLTGNAVQQN